MFYNCKDVYCTIAMHITCLKPFRDKSFCCVDPSHNTLNTEQSVGYSSCREWFLNFGFKKC